ncbi:hypothetical protein [Streptomyces sp. W007]|uniref:hypothetical protein n=1 Tax=Streptomyces sp. W007 TaxID=1055352 RepID=UPI0003173BD2|nr:hypothetical protein [Streptomyces sp. W007]
MGMKDFKRDPNQPAATPTSSNPNAGTGGDYRRIATATGPAATKGSRTPTTGSGEETAEDGSPAAFRAQQDGGDEETDGSE